MQLGKIVLSEHIAQWSALLVCGIQSESLKGENFQYWKHGNSAKKKVCLFSVEEQECSVGVMVLWTSAIQLVSTIGS